MRLSAEQVRKFKNSFIELNGERETKGSTIMSLVETIEALQQEIEQLKDENASLRNWNACEEELYNELLESDKRRWELELELEDANNYRAGLEAIVDKLRAHVARMRDALQYYADVKRWGTVNLQYVPTPEVAKKALAEIDKAIGGKEDA